MSERYSFGANGLIWDDVRGVWLTRDQVARSSTLEDRQADAFAIQRGGMTKAQDRALGDAEAFPIPDAHGDVGKALAQQAAEEWPVQDGQTIEGSGRIFIQQPDEDLAAFQARVFTAMRDPALDYQAVDKAVDEALASPAPSAEPVSNPNGDQALKGNAEGYAEGWAKGYQDGWDHIQRVVQSSMTRTAARGFRPVHLVPKEG